MALKLEDIQVPEYERVVRCTESTTGMSALVAIHNTNLGPACGGIRMLNYRNQDEAMYDVLRLSKGMSYKSALAGIGFGGGKSVLIGDPAKKTPALFHAFGEAVDKLGGRYIAAKDMNISTADLIETQKKTRHVLGMDGVPGSSGDPSPMTAHGVLRALEATVERIAGTKKLAGVKIAIQGIGNVGYGVAKLVRERGAEIWVSDINQPALEQARKELQAHVVPNEAIFDVACDIFSPNARGAILDEKTIPRLKCKAVVGAANNQLVSAKDGFRLHERGILYAPDYAVNSGGIVNIFIEFENGSYDEAKALKKTDGVYDTIKLIFQRAKEKNTAPFVVADELAEERLYGRKK